jgi:nucleotide-binding universal stress UspA family protein
MKSILVATDFSNNAKNALKYANAFAEATQHQLLLLNVYMPSLGQYSAMHAIIAEETINEKSRCHKQLKGLVGKYVTVPTEDIVAEGEAINEILKTCKKSNANFIIVGTHGASGIKKALVGSNTSKVIAKAEVPVIAIPERYRFQKVETIVYATDLKNTINELKVLIPIAKLLNCAIEIVYLKYSWDKDIAQKVELEKKIKRLSFKNISIVEQKASIEKTMIDQLKNYISKTKPQMLAMFPSDKSWFDKIFSSSKTEELAYELKIPMLSIRKKLVKTD